MAKTSGVDAQALSLPSGGGAVQGLGATFETDLNTGTGSYSVPIDLPCGPNGLQPTVTLRYHSAAGNGPFGLGWTLGAMTIARKTDGRIPDYGPGDRFVLVGVDDLVPVAGGYRPRVDTMHARIVRAGDGWELTDTRGLRHVLGATGAARVETVDGGLTRTAEWRLERMIDTSGNAIEYRYQAAGAQRYLSEIAWGGYALRFVYEARPDTVSSCRYGFLLATALRCARIELHVPALAPSLVRTWTLGYHEAPGSGVSLLQQVTLTGHDAAGGTLANPPLTLGYTAAGAPALERMTGPAPGFGPGRFEHGRTELLDWDGDGLPDVVEIARGQLRVWPNRGRGRLGEPRSIGQVPSPMTFDERGVAFADMDGNGTADLVVLDRPLAGYYPHLPGGGFGRLVSWRSVPAHALAAGDARLVDLDGDGVIDLLVTGDAFWSLYLRDPAAGGWAEARVLPRHAVPPVSFGDPRVTLADMNGDGLQDLVRIDGGGVTWWPYAGNGRWLDAVRLETPPALPRDHDPRRLFVVDIDGDGCADFVYLGLDSVTVWHNQGGVRASPPRTIDFLPGALPTQVRLADLYGRGTVGIVYSSVAEGARRGDWLYLDLAGGVKPYLLTEIDNGLGLRSEIVYRPSTEIAVDAAEAGAPWRTFHPFPVQCVAEVRATDAVTGAVGITRHHYGEARYDGEARAFLGFGTVDVESVGDAEVPTLRTRNVFHLGLDPADPARRLTSDERMQLGALRRRLLRSELYGADGSAAAGRPYQVVHHDYTVRVEPGADGESVYVPYETRTLEAQWERAAAPAAFREIAYLDVDDAGNIRRQTTRVWRAGVAADDQNLTTEIRFARNDARHVVSLPARVTQRDQAGKVVAATITRYDGPAHTGLAEGEVDTGHISCVETLAIDDALAASAYGAAQPDWAALGYHRVDGETGWWIRKTSYARPDDRTLIARGPRGFDTTLVLDPTRQFPATLTDPVGAAITGAPDPRVFQMVSFTDANGHTTRDRFDPLGRVTAVIKPGDDDALPTTIYEYAAAASPASVTTRSRRQSGDAATEDRIEYATGRGERLQVVSTGEGGPGRAFVVQEARAYSVRGQLVTRVLPYYRDTAAYAPPPAAQPRLRLRYDALGRIVEQVQPDGSRVTQDMGPCRVVILDDIARAATPQRTVTRLLDGLGRPIGVEHQLADRVARSRYEYDTLGHLARFVGPDGVATTTTFDLLGRIVVQHHPDTGRTVFVHDAAGNQVARSNAAGQTVRHTVDPLDRLIAIRDDAAPDAEVSYRYLDPGAPAPPDGAQNRIGRLWQVTDRIGTVTLSYDALGRTIRQDRGVTALGRSFVTDVVHDALGREVRVTLPEPTPGAGRRVIDTQLNRRGLPQAMPGYVNAVEYDALGNPVRTVYKNGVEVSSAFSPLTGRPHQLTVVGPGGAVLRDQTFQFDPGGNLSRIDSPIAVEAGSFAYDDWYHLTDARYDSGEIFHYDVADGGNLTSATGTGALGYAPGSTAVTAAGGAAYGYDAAGRMHSAPYGTLRYDAFDNLVRVDRPAGAAIELGYDYRGRRALRRSGASSVLIVDDSLEIHDGQPVLWIQFGGRRIAALSGGGGVFVHTDWLGALTLFTGLDGGLVRRVAFGPYGTLRHDSGAAGVDLAAFGGGPIDPDLGLVCMGRRFFDPRLGRFLSPDAVVGEFYRIDAWNPYAYGYGNPLRYVDPTGYFSVGDFFAIVAIVIVVAALVVAGVFTGGTTWAVAGAVINVSALMFATAAGVAAGAIIGGYAAYKAGGDLWKGILFGGFVGGVAAFAGGILGAVAGSAVGGLFAHGSLLSMLTAGGVGGAVQGVLAGAGTGATIGFGGGKGSAALMWQYIWRGAAMGAITGFLLGVASAYIFATPNASLHVGLEKFQQNPLTVSGADSYASMGESVARNIGEGTASHGWGAFVGIGSGPSTSWGTLSIPIGWVPTVMFNYGGISALVSTGIALDKWTTYGFDKQLFLVLTALPFFIGTALDIWDWANWGQIHEKIHDAFSTHDLPPSG